VSKRLEMKHSRVVKGIDSGATFSFVGISKSTFSLQYTLLSQKKIGIVFCGNLWFFDWDFEGLILSFLKLSQKTLLFQ
jgi:hypothetical protein